MRSSSKLAMANNGRSSILILSKGYSNKSRVLPCIPWHGRNNYLPGPIWMNPIMQCYNHAVIIKYIYKGKMVIYSQKVITLLQHPWIDPKGQLMEHFHQLASNIPRISNHLSGKKKNPFQFKGWKGNITTINNLKT